MAGIGVVKSLIAQTLEQLGVTSDGVYEGSSPSFGTVTADALTMNGQITWSAGNGAITDIFGPPDENLDIQAGPGQTLNFRGNTGNANLSIGASVVNIGGADGLAMFERIEWATGIGAITHALGPSDQPMVIMPGTGQTLDLRRHTGSTSLQIQANGNISLAASVTFNTDLVMAFGGSGESQFGYSSAQTPDSFVWGLPASSNNLIFCELTDRGFDFAHALETNPTLFGHSANQSTTEWWSLTHDQTNPVLSWGTGALQFAGGQVTWPTGLGAIAQIQGPSDEQFIIATGATQPLFIQSGNASGASAAGNLTFKGGDGASGGGNPGSLALKGGNGGTGTNDNGAGVTIDSGVPDGSGLGGQVTVGATSARGVFIGNDTSTLNLRGVEESDLAAPAANAGVIYFRDSGGGKTQLVVRFNTGAIQVVAVEP